MTPTQRQAAAYAAGWPGGYPTDTALRAAFAMSVRPPSELLLPVIRAAILVTAHGVCQYCRTRALLASLEPFNPAGNLACRDTIACGDRQAAADIRALYAGVNGQAAADDVDQRACLAAARWLRLGEYGHAFDTKIQPLVLAALDVLRLAYSGGFPGLKATDD